MREAQAAVTAAQDAGQDEATIAELQATADELSGQRDSLFKGETLRGLLLSTFAWSTIGRIAGIAAIVAFVAAGVMLVLVIAGLVHRSRTATDVNHARIGLPATAGSPNRRVRGRCRSVSSRRRARALDAEHPVHARELQHPGHGARR